MGRTSLILVAGCFVLTPVPSEARPERIYQVPSTPDGCNTCHQPPRRALSYPRNVFGQAVEATLSRPGEQGQVNWPAVCSLDSDGDGASNGLELGDPECNWPDDPGVDTGYHPGRSDIAPPGSGGGSGGGNSGGGSSGGGNSGGGSSGGGTSGGGTGGGNSGGGNTGGSVADAGAGPDLAPSTPISRTRPDGGNEFSAYGPNGPEDCTCIRTAPIAPSWSLLLGAAVFILGRRRASRRA